MTDRYVGPGGNDGNSGLTWALRKLTLNGVEDTPIVAGDTVYVGPGVYREQLVCDVVGTSGNVITYIGDVTGENTDGVGGIVRVTGSDDDETVTRTIAIEIDRDYRTFRGFAVDLAGTAFRNVGGDYNIVEDCFVQYCGVAIMNGASCTDCIVRRCFCISRGTAGAETIDFNESGGGDQSDTGHLIENCIVIGARNANCIRSQGQGGMTIKNCLLHGGYRGVFSQSQAVGQSIDVNNCIIINCYHGLEGEVLGDLIEDYNTFWGNTANRDTVDTGANSEDFPPLFTPPLLLDGFQFPWWFGELSEWSKVARIAGTSEPTDDFFGIARPTTSSKKSWGPLQLREAERETTTVYDSSTASIKLADAGDAQFFVPVDGSEITISVQAYREANYAGTLPRMIIRQPGQADRVTTDTGSASQWNELTDTFTPDSGTEFVVVILRSLNTATSGSYDTFFDSLQVA